MSTTENRNKFDTRNLIEGSLGKCIAKINDKEEDLIYLVSINARIDTEADKQRCTGEMEIYYGNASKFINIYMKDINYNLHTYFDLIIINYDPKSNLGLIVTVLKDVYVTGVEIAKIEKTCGALTQNIKFAFKDIGSASEYINTKIEDNDKRIAEITEKIGKQIQENLKRASQC